MVICMPKSELFPYDVYYVSKGVEILYDLRCKSESCLGNYIDRLTKEAKAYSDVFNRLKSQNQQKNVFFYYLKRVVFTLIEKLKLFLFFVMHLHFFFAQKKKIDAIGETGSRVLCIAIGLNRLNSEVLSLGVRNYLSSISKTFLSHSDQPNIDKDILSYPHVFVCDLLAFSPLWNYRELCRKEGVFIIDRSFLIFLIGLELVKFRWKRVLKLFKISIPMAVFLEGYYLMFHKISKIKAVFYTSNSFSIEVLRLFLIQSKQCEFLVEIMHGIPTVFYERYLKQILELGDCYSYHASMKHSSISQIPKLPMFGVLIEDVKYDDSVAINSFFNKYIVEKLQSNVSLLAFIESECTSLLLNDMSEVPLIISFSGAASYTACYFNSDLFNLECFIMEYIKCVLSEYNVPFVIIYTPHPAYSYRHFVEQSFFQDEKMILYKETIYTWFVSDLSISLYSGSVFESAYFGIDSFMPTIKKDMVYSANILDLLQYPKQCFFIDELSHYLIRHVKKEILHPLVKAKKRISSINI
jgi:hypothetical protein